MRDPQHILETAGVLRRALSCFDASGLDGREAAALAEELAATEKTCGAARILAAARAVACGAHKEEGIGDPFRWVARHAGTTMRQAKDALTTAAALESCPSTKDALLAGEVSLLQAQEITRAAAELPGEENDLLALAKGGDLSSLRDEVRVRRLRSIPVTDLYRRQLAARRFHHFRDGLGMVRFEGALPPRTGIPLVARIEREAKRLYREHKRTGHGSSFETYAADAFVSLCGSSEVGAKRSPNTDLVILCDLYAWRRGHAHEPEPCHLIGGGPIPVDVAKHMARDAFVKVVFHDGVEIQRVRHLGRHYTAELRTALDLGPVPAFTGRACARCKSTFGLQHDHQLPVAANGLTSIENLQDLCYHCHAEKTERDRKTGLLGRGAKMSRPRRPGRDPP